MRIKVIKQKHQGLPSARNTGLTAAKGEYIGFVDSDDWIEPNTYEYAYQKMKQYDVDMVCWGANVITEDDYVISPDYLDYQKIHITGIRPYDAYAYMNSTVNIWNKLFKSSIIMENNIRFLDNYIFEDNDFLAKYVLFCKNVFYSDQYLYNHLKHQNSITGDIANQKNQHLIYIDLYISTYNFYKEHNAVIKNKELLNAILDNNLIKCQYNSDKKVLNKKHKQLLKVVDNNILNNENLAALQSSYQPGFKKFLKHIFSIKKQ